MVEPLAAYSAALALFGLPHVLSELRYVDQRFGRRLERGQLASILALLALIVSLRTAVLLQFLPSQIGVPAELAGVAALALACVRGPVRRKALALAVGLTLGAGALGAPFGTMITLSILHNATPLGLLWQLAPRGDRRLLMTWATMVLIGLPLFVATGLPRLALVSIGVAGTNADPIGAGPLADHLYVYVPSLLESAGSAVDIFTASVVAQGGHYLMVIVILPMMLRRLDVQAQGLMSWPRSSGFALILAGAGALSLLLFLDGFAQARSFYSLAAALHAWIEIPVLILALTGGVHHASQRPASSDAELARSEIIIA